MNEAGEDFKLKVLYKGAYMISEAGAQQ